MHDGEPRRRLAGTSGGLLALLAVFTCLATTYSIVTPLYEAPDEAYHYPFVKHLADGHSLPVQDPAHPGPWRQEGSQPPLYYALAALVTRWVPTGDLPAVLQVNPHADIGIARPDRNANMVIHTPREGPPYRGAVLAIHLARGLSVILGALTVLFTYRIGLEVAPRYPGKALAAAAIVALTPMFLFISGSVNNDNLAITLSTIALWLLLRNVRATFTSSPSPAAGLRILAPWVLLGVVVGLAALAKVSALGLLPLAALALAWVAVRRRDWRFFVLGGACVLGAAALVAGWWYYRNWRLYHDPLGWNVFIAIAEARPARATLRELWREVPGLVKSYWGVFGWMNVVAPWWYYRLCEGLVVLAATGLIFAAGRRLRERRLPVGDEVLRLGLVAIWPLVVMGGLIRWTSLTRASQGRLLFPAIAALSYLMVLGLTCWAPLAIHAAYCVLRVPYYILRIAYSVLRVPSPAPGATLATSEPTPALPGERPAQADSRNRQHVTRFTLHVSRFTLYAVPLFFATLAAWVPFRVIAPAYARPPLLTAAQEAAIAQRLDLSFGERMTLLGYQIAEGEAEPGQDLVVTLYWRALAPMDHNYSVFIHLLDENGLLVGQRDVYPGQGLLPTTLWRPGEAIADTYRVRVGRDTFNPSHIQLEAGLYRLDDGSRLPVRDREGRTLGDSARFGEALVRAEPRDGIANPVYHNLENKVALVGYDLDRTALKPGEALHVTLLWRALAPLAQNYTVFARLLGPDNNAWAAKEAWPQDGAAPTSRWPVGQVIRDSYELVLRPDTPEGIYSVGVGLFLPETQQNLKVLRARGEQAGNHIVLTRVRVLPKPPSEVAKRQFTFPAIQHPLDAVIGDVARLRGFALERQSVRAGEPFRVTLYWEALNEGPAPADLAVFIHLLDPANRVVAQHDGMPASGAWPTTTWIKGQAIVDDHDLAFRDLGFRGEALLEVGLYDPQSMQRLAVASGEDRIILPIRINVGP